MEENTQTKKKWDWADKAISIDHEMRKDSKKKGRGVLKSHYFLLFMICMIVAFAGVESTIGQYGQEALKSTNSTQHTESADDSVRSGFDQVVVKLLKGDVKGAFKTAQNDENERVNRKVTKDVLGTQAGIIAGVVNKFEAGTVMVTIFSAFKKITHSNAAAMSIIILLVLGFYLAIWTFLLNVLRAIKRRVFLEARMYDKVPVSHMLYMKNAGKWGRAAITMLMESIYISLWAMTVVMWPTKHYAYWATSFIVAENPTLNSRQAITLSRKMMYGYKWKMFIYDLSYIGWDILSVITLGLLDYFFVEPMHTAADTELYAAIRENYIANKLDDYELLDDKYLYEKADQELLNRTYEDNIETAEYIKANRITLKGVQKFFAVNLGIWFGRTKTQQAYEDVELLVVENQKNEDIVAGRIYPGRLSPIAKLWIKKKKPMKLNYLKTYTIWNLVAMFFLFAFVGWGWEVMLHVVKDGVFINRGTMYGPWLPIYGWGGVMILTVLNRCRKSPVVLALATFVLCGFVEYGASWYLEVTKGQRWWDYTGYFLNLNGRICAEGLMVFMLAGIAVTYLVAPMIDRMLTNVDSRVAIPIILMLLITFVADQRYTGKHPNGGSGVTNYTRYIEAEKNEAEDKAKTPKEDQGTATDQSGSDQSTEETDKGMSLILPEKLSFM